MSEQPIQQQQQQQLVMMQLPYGNPRRPVPEAAQQTGGPRRPTSPDDQYR